MARVIRTIEHAPRAVAGVAVQVTELIWNDGGRSFDVYRADTDELLTEDESFDEPPTDEQIAIRLQQQPEPDSWWTCPGCGTGIDASQADLIGEHVLVTCDRVDGTGNPGPEAS